MDESKYAFKTLLELKSMLRDRKMKVSGKKKGLIDRLVFNDHNARPDEPDVEYHMDVPSYSLYKDFNSDAKANFPPVTRERLSDYLKSCQMEFQSKIESLYSERYIRYIRAAPGTGNIYVTAAVWAEMRKTTCYKVDISLSMDGVVDEAQCECAVGQGPAAHCKHVITVVFALTKLSGEGAILTEMTCTQVLQTFHHGSPVKARDLSKIRGKPNAILYDPRPAEYKTQDQKEAYNDRTRHMAINYQTHMRLPLLQLYPPANIRGLAHDHDYFKLSMEQKFLEDEQRCITGQAASKQEDFWEPCCYGRLHLVKKHIEEGIDVNWVSYTHDSCASQGKPEVVEMLLDAYCDVNAQDNRGNLAIHHAAMRGHSDILKTLIDAKSDINRQEKNGWTALHCAAYWCQPKAVDVLIKKGSDVSIQNKDQRTALHEVARSQETSEPNLGDITRTLIDAGCNINAKSSDEGEADFTPLMFAAYHGHPEIAMALLDARCEMNSYGTNMRTALHWAADRDNEEVVYMLLEAGADPTLRGLRGELAADRAKTKELGDTLYNAYNMHCELASLDVKFSPTKFVPTFATKINVPINSSISTHMPKGNFNATVHVNKQTEVGGEDVVTAATNEQHVSNIKALLAICQRRQKDKALKAKVKADAVNYNASGNVDEAIAKDKDTDHSNKVKPVEKSQIGSITEMDGKKQCDPLSCIAVPDHMYDPSPSRIPDTLEADEENCNNLSTSDFHVVSFDHSPYIDQMRDSSPSRVPETLEDAGSSAVPTQGGKETNSTSTSTDCSCCSDSSDRMHGPGRGDNSDSSIPTQDETECIIVSTADSPSTPTSDSQNDSTSDSQNDSTSDSQSIPLGLVQTESVDENEVDEIAEPANKSSSSGTSDEHTSDIVPVETDSISVLSENMLDNKPAILTGYFDRLFRPAILTGYFDRLF